MYFYAVGKFRVRFRPKSPRHKARAVATRCGMQDYTQQLDTLVKLLSRPEIPAWMIALIGTFVGAFLTALFSLGVEWVRKRQKICELELGLCREVAKTWEFLKQAREYYNGKPDRNSVIRRELSEQLNCAFYKHTTATPELFQNIEHFEDINDIYKSIQSEVLSESTVLRLDQRIEAGIRTIEAKVHGGIFRLKFVRQIQNSDTRYQFEALMSGNIKPFTATAG